jgi:hypothetical protein
MSEGFSTSKVEGTAADDTSAPRVPIEVIEERVEVVDEPAQRAQPPVAIFPAEAVEAPPDHSWPVRGWLAFCSIVAWLFGLASVLIGLAFLAAVPILQFLSLGYLLEASGRIARTGRFRAGFVGFKEAARAGSMVLGTWLLLWPLRFLADFWYSAQLVAPDGQPAIVLRLLLLILTALFIANVILAWFSGGKLRHFFWPVLAPPFFGMWLLRRIVASQYLRPLVKPVVGSISPRMLADLTTVPALDEWFPPAIFYTNWRRGGLFARARDAVWEFFQGANLMYFFSLGARGFLGAVLWLFLPAALMIGVTKVPAVVSQLGASDGALRLATALSALAGFIGSILMAVVLLYLPFLQTHLAAENRLSAVFELRTIRQLFRRAPVAYGFALFITFLFALPLFLLKIEYTLRELLWIPSLVFVVFIYPARLLTGWAMARAKRRQTPRFFLVRFLVQFLELPVVAFYVLVLFFTQYVSWSGSWSVLEQPPFLLPAPFFFGM